MHRRRHVRSGFDAVRRSAPVRRRRTAGDRSRSGPEGTELQGLPGNAAVLRELTRTAGAGNRIVRGVVDRKLPVSLPGDAWEREAEGDTTRSRSPSRSASTHPLSTSDAPVPIPPAVRHDLNRRLGEMPRDLRVFQGPEATEAATLLGARAFAHGRDVYLGPGASVLDRDLMAHEVAHAGAGRDVVQRREATWLERRAWLAFFDHYLPRKFLNNYMDDTGNPITLTAQEMEDCNPLVDISRSSAFQAEVSRLNAAGGGSAAITCTGWGGALTNGTLGNFTIHYDGTLAVAPNGSWTFTGTMWFEDYWDFNTGGANRPVAAEVKVRAANALLPGQPFDIDSVTVPVSQSSGDQWATWSAAQAQHVPDQLGRTGTDIEVGAGVGIGTISPEVEAGGGEFGAQSSEDLN